MNFDNEFENAYMAQPEETEYIEGFEAMLTEIDSLGKEEVSKTRKENKALQRERQLSRDEVLERRRTAVAQRAVNDHEELLKELLERQASGEKLLRCERSVINKAEHKEMSEQSRKERAALRAKLKEELKENNSRSRKELEESVKESTKIRKEKNRSEHKEERVKHLEQVRAKAVKKKASNVKKFASKTEEIMKEIQNTDDDNFYTIKFNQLITEVHFMIDEFDIKCTVKDKLTLTNTYGKKMIRGLFKAIEGRVTSVEDALEILYRAFANWDEQGHKLSGKGNSFHPSYFSKAWDTAIEMYAPFRGVHKYKKQVSVIEENDSYFEGPALEEVYEDGYETFSHEDLVKALRDRDKNKISTKRVTRRVDNDTFDYVAAGTELFNELFTDKEVRALAKKVEETPFVYESWLDKLKDTEFMKEPLALAKLVENTPRNPEPSPLIEELYRSGMYKSPEFINLIDWDEVQATIDKYGWYIE